MWNTLPVYAFERRTSDFLEKKVFHFKLYTDGQQATNVEGNLVKVTGSASAVFTPN